MLFRLGHPARFAVHPREPGRRAQVRVEQARPVAEAAADVSKRGSVRQTPARSHEIEKIRVPPEVALGTELFGGVRRERGIRFHIKALDLAGRNAKTPSLPRLGLRGLTGSR